MKIKEIVIRGFKSFGHNKQVLELDPDKGQLWLISGENGAGKSSLISSVEWTIFGKTRGRTRKWSSQKSLPNRINGELLNSIKFISDSGIDVELTRGLNPNILELKENDIPYINKDNIDSRIDKLVGMDIETFKSFISMSINDFKNFTSLSTEEKNMLLDKLFNLEIIKLMADVLKEIGKNNKTTINIIDSEIKSIDKSISSIKKSIDKSITKSLENNSNEIENCKKFIKDNKDNYLQLKDKISKISNKFEEINNLIISENKNLSKLESEISNTQYKIDLYDSGKCPTCETDFNNQLFLDLKSILIEKKNELNLFKITIEDNLKDYKSKKIKLDQISLNTNKTFNDLNTLMISNKNKITELSKKNEDDIINVSEFNKMVDDMLVEKTEKNNNLSTHTYKEKTYKELWKILGENGVRKSIINGIIKPINDFISNNIKLMNIPFEVSLDRDFNTKIKSLGNEIEHDSLSTGENKKINICILMAYLELIRGKKYINVLFLDEVFSSMDLNSIEDILYLLKYFSNKNNINIFVVHHAVMNEKIFDRILKIEKNIFTTIQEITN